MKRKTCEKYVLSVLVRTGDKPCDMRTAKRECAKNLEYFGSYEALYHAVACHYYTWKTHNCKTNFASEWNQLAHYHRDEHIRLMCEVKHLIPTEMTYGNETDIFYLTKTQHEKYLKGEDPFE